MPEMITNLITAEDSVRRDLRVLIGAEYDILPGRDVFIIPFGRVDALREMSDDVRETALRRMQDEPYHGAAVPEARLPIPWRYTLTVSDAKQSFMVYPYPEVN